MQSRERASGISPMQSNYVPCQYSQSVLPVESKQDINACVKLCRNRVSQEIVEGFVQAAASFSNVALRLSEDSRRKQPSAHVADTVPLKRRRMFGAARECEEEKLPEDLKFVEEVYIDESEGRKMAGTSTYMNELRNGHIAADDDIVKTTEEKEDTESGISYGRVSVTDILRQDLSDIDSALKTPLLVRERHATSAPDRRSDAGHGSVGREIDGRGVDMELGKCVPVEGRRMSEGEGRGREMNKKIILTTGRCGGRQSQGEKNRSSSTETTLSDVEKASNHRIGLRNESQRHRLSEALGGEWNVACLESKLACLSRVQTTELVLEMLADHPEEQRKVLTKYLEAVDQTGGTTASAFSPNAVST
eukprot:GHVQ01007744.1.p1 GENE.GHVQ01007744.1~~GHVQ01007744.1.p1  ORF type:complete len:363 (+),score=72.31 GHVQ01007744.1:218-1306(+)